MADLFLFGLLSLIPMMAAFALVDGIFTAEWRPSPVALDIHSLKVEIAPGGGARAIRCALYGHGSARLHACEL